MLVTDKRLKIAGSSLLGVFAKCTDKVLLVPQEVGEADRQVLEAGLKVPAVKVLAGVGSVLGSLVAANSNGFMVTHHAGSEELEILREHGRVARLPARINAAGNIILVNDSAALVHPELSGKACETIEQTLGVKLEKGTIGGLKTVGMAGVATNRGLLVHPRVSEEEIAVLERLFEPACRCGHSEPRLAAGGLRSAGQQPWLLRRNWDFWPGAGTHRGRTRFPGLMIPIID